MRKLISSPSIPSAEVEGVVWAAIRKTINKFREHPYYFFTESDIVAYFSQSVYSSKLEVKREGKRIYLVHREYPTNFRYQKDHLIDTGYTPFDLKERKGDRGNFDVAVLNPDFVTSCPSVKDIVNKSVRHLELRAESDTARAARELLFAIEFKYVINSSIAFASEIAKDNIKLRFASDLQTKWAVNLVFCNTNPKYLDIFTNAVISAEPSVVAIFIQSYYDNLDNKIAPKPATNCADTLASKLLGANSQAGGPDATANSRPDKVGVLVGEY